MVGAGFTGLSCAITLAERGVEVEVFEKSSSVGGLAVGITSKNWSWSLDKYYHHIFTNDRDIIEMAKKVGLPPHYLSPTTSSLINGKVLRLDSPLSVLGFSELSLLARIRMGLGLATLKLIPNGLFLEKFRVIDFLPKLIGKEAYEKIWERLLSAKFGSQKKIVNMAWFWSRIAKRTKNLGYFEGGFLSLVLKMQLYLEKHGGKLHLNSELEMSKKTTKKYDKIILTTPAPVANIICGKKILPEIEYLWAQTLVLELKFSLINSYWLNILEKDWPFLVVVEHTNLVSKNNFGDKVIVYLGNYLESDSLQLKLSKDEVLKKYLKYIKLINPEFNTSWITDSFLFRAQYAQPVFPINYSKKLSGVYKWDDKFLFSNMSMVYPFDRGTNYAVKLGVDIAKTCLQ